MTAACMDHLVVVATDLASGAQWCQERLGATPAGGGSHPLMGTHNRLLNVSSAAHPRAYLEIVAIEAGAPNSLPDGHRRWFDMDDEFLQQRVATGGPQLVAWVACVPDVSVSSAALLQRGLDCGPAIRASRPTAAGMLSWTITVRSDGQRVMQGCVPTLIAWDGAHPCDRLAPSGVQLQDLALSHPQGALLSDACSALGLACIPARTAHVPMLQARFSTPHGDVEIHSAV